MIWLLALQLHMDACNALCKRDGYNYGHTIKGNCHCVDDKGNIDDFIHRRLSLPDVSVDENPPRVIYRSED